MTTQKIIARAEENKGNHTLASAVKEICRSLESVGKIDTEGFEGEQYADGSATIYKAEDGYVIVIDTDEEDFFYTASQIDRAQGIAANKLYEHTFVAE